MRKQLCIIIFTICLLFAACSTSSKLTSGLKTDTITVYDIATGKTGLITDSDPISDLAASADTASWKK